MVAIGNTDQLKFSMSFPAVLFHPRVFFEKKVVHTPCSERNNPMLKESKECSPTPAHNTAVTWQRREGSSPLLWYEMSQTVRAGNSSTALLNMGRNTPALQHCCYNHPPVWDGLANLNRAPLNSRYVPSTLPSLLRATFICQTRHTYAI